MDDDELDEVVDTIAEDPAGDGDPLPDDIPTDDVSDLAGPGAIDLGVPVPDTDDDSPFVGTLLTDDEIDAMEVTES